MLRHWVTGFKSQVEGDHDVRVKRVVDLIVLRMRGVDEKKRLSQQHIEKLVRDGLSKLRVIEPSVKVIFKNFTVESTKDGEFVGALEKVLPASELNGWFEIFHAAPAFDVKT